MFSQKLKNKSSSQALIMLLGIISGCSNLSLKEEKTLPPVKKNVSQQSSSVQDNNKTVPDWINSLVKDLNSKPVKDSPESIIRYQYKGQIVYYFSPACCGKMSNLYDQGKNLLCKPDGGTDGKGDGKCPTFITERIEEKLIWAENRD